MTNARKNKSNINVGYKVNQDHSITNTRKLFAAITNTTKNTKQQRQKYMYLTLPM